MTFKKFCLVGFVGLIVQFSKAQEGLPIYSDYLTDNYYLIHPSMAGVANCAKIRLTARKQWFGVDNAPALQTMSINSRIGETQSAVGAIVYNDNNGYHSQTGAYLTYAHHLLFSRNEIDLNMLSFGLSAGAIQYRLDSSTFELDGYDPLIAESDPSAINFNLDFGFSYHFINFYAHATVKNVLNNDGVNVNESGLYKYDNLRTLLFSAGNVFSKLGSDWSYEPSIMFLYRDGTKESSIDLNAKVYKEMEFGKLWGGMSYRRSLDGAEVSNGAGVSSQKLQYITPFVGVDYKNFVFAYTYSYQSNSVVFNNGGFHQLTLGYNFNCRKRKYECACPAIN
ncbi:type IX secretion system membrane protein PorP/SprF [uncultured Gelidibacter sp.]|uniref:PorP/SprF family type IX secretion system membrane protein n=1 Tax=uncultured Gelidibacter sp. TaxID=259318 RepID=UPI00261F2B10|nr:type IX secretion system membrane protein PorP/SprF [uncultured Gelidibacter sp.]